MTSKPLILNKYQNCKVKLSYFRRMKQLIWIKSKSWSKHWNHINNRLKVEKWGLISLIRKCLSLHRKYKDLKVQLLIFRLTFTVTRRWALWPLTSKTMWSKTYKNLSHSLKKTKEAPVLLWMKRTTKMFS